jgi:hypothetical protein
MAGTVEHLAHLEPWYAEWLEPAHHQVYRGELETALATIAAAAEQLERETGFTPDERQVLRYEIGWTPFNFVSFVQSGERVARLYAQAQAVIDEPPLGPVSAPTQAFYQLALASKGVTFGLAQPTEGAVRYWAARVPAERIVTAYWMHLATLGFYLGLPDLVEDAFGELLVSASGLRDSYVWLRVNLMHLIMEQRATLQDFQELLKIIQHYGELNSFKRDFLPPARELGIEDELQAQIGPLEARLHADQHPPEIEDKTKRITRSP